jgi:hypothetical protein
MPNYQNGKIYKIVANTNEEYKPYVGSSVQQLSNRMSAHRADYIFWKNLQIKNKKVCASYELFERFGIENCKIILVEDYPCNNYEQLIARERYWYDNIENCNKIRPCRTEEEKKGSFIYQRALELRPNHVKEKYQRTLEKNPNHNKEQYQRAIELNPNRQQEQYQKHKEKILQQKKEYYKINKEKIVERNKKSYECLCGSIICKGGKAIHERSLKHQNYLYSLKV